MPSRCLNRVLLIGNLTRDPELRYTPVGMAVVSFGLATNRVWMTKQGERKEDAQFHRIVAWNKLAELCSQLLSKGRRIYVDGRIQYREFIDNEGVKKQITEIVIDDMIILDNKGMGMGGGDHRGDMGGDVVQQHEDVAVTNNGNLTEEDIIIPDDLTSVGTVDEQTPVVEDKKEEEMPF